MKFFKSLLFVVLSIALSPVMAGEIKPYSQAQFDALAEQITNDPAAPVGVRERASDLVGLYKPQETASAAPQPVSPQPASPPPATPPHGRPHIAGPAPRPAP